LQKKNEPDRYCDRVISSGADTKASTRSLGINENSFYV